MTNASYQYDLINRLTQLTDSASLNTTFSYDVTNKITSRTIPNGVATTYQYDGLDRLARLTHTKAPTTIADFQYQFNVASNISQLTDGAGAHNYSYDLVDRLTAATHPNQTNESYSYEAVGNRTASHQGSSYTYQTFNRLLTANSSSFSYDANGNLTTKTDATGTWSYTWDYENRLKQASLSGGVSVTHAYDALGRRIQRSSSTGATTKFVYDGADVIRDLNADLTVATDYLNGPGIDDKLRQTSGGTPLYFIQDHLGSTRSLVDASGNVTASLSYDSFGKVVSGSASTRYTYTGREADADTGLIYYRARWYDPQQGRFISEDPIGLEGGINVFAYVENNPLRFTDPSGLCPQQKKCTDDTTLNEVASKTIGGKLDRSTGTVKGADATYNQIVERLQNAQFERFHTNINPEHIGGNDFQGFVNGNWYHATVGRPQRPGLSAGAGGSIGDGGFNPNGYPPFIQLHCEPHRPNSLEHLGKDFLMPRIAPYLPLLRKLIL